jgi:hypothetical protein
MFGVDKPGLKTGGVVFEIDKMIMLRDVIFRLETCKCCLQS